jgi:hypothetical protein
MSDDHEIRHIGIAPAPRPASPNPGTHVPVRPAPPPTAPPPKK